MKRVAVYSGTFDPVHKGHEWLVRYVLNERAYDELILLIEPEPRRKSNITLLKHRIAMAQLVFADDSRVAINPLHQKTGHHTLTQTLDEIREYTGNDADIALVMGGDVFEYVPKWEGIDSVKQDISFIVALRSEDDGEIAVSLMQGELADAKVHLVASIFPHLSSSVARNALRSDADTSKYVQDAVADYAIKEQLYDADET